jgi:hypothetical protein
MSEDASIEQGHQPNKLVTLVMWKNIELIVIARIFIF